MGLFQGLFTAPSWQSFLLLACGWALSAERHTITTYLWLTGATTLKHFSRFYVFLGGRSTRRAGSCGRGSFGWRPRGCPTRSPL